MSKAIHILHNENDYQAALSEYESYFDDEPAAGSEAGDRFELLGLLIATYEDAHFPMPSSGPVEAIRFAMERQNLGQPALAELLESRSRASEILSGRRELTLPQIRKLAKEWRIPAHALIGELETA